MTHERTGVTRIQHLVSDIYLPFAEINRAISWPNSGGARHENNAEHSFSLAIVCGCLADEVGLDANTVATKALVHDLVELHAGDTSVWDEAGIETKKEREHAAFLKLKSEHFHNAWLITSIEEYEVRMTEADRFVYAMDKLLATLMVLEDGGTFWKENGISYERYLQKAAEKREQVSEHPTVLGWYDSVLAHISENKGDYF